MRNSQPNVADAFKNVKPLFDQLQEKCDMIEQLIIASLNPQRDQTLKVKCFKRQHNFEKFRKEMKEIVGRAIGDLRETQDLQKEVTLKNLQTIVQQEDFNAQKKEIEAEREKVNSLKQKLKLLQKTSDQNLQDLQSQVNEVKSGWKDSDIAWERNFKRESESHREEIRWLQTQLAAAAS